MKTLRLSILIGLTMVTMAGNAQSDNPGWVNVSGRNTTPSIPNDSSGTPQTTTPSAPQPAFTFGALLTQQSPTNIAEAITPDIQALANGLQDNPVKIYNYVHDHIRYVVYFGSKKGAELTLLEKSGNDFDQSALLVAMLRAAGYNASYQFGWMGIPYDATNGTHNDVHHWFQLNLTNSNWNYTSNYLYNLLWNIRGYPTYYLNYANQLLFQRVWVAVTVGGTNYLLDPAFKVSEPVASVVNIASAMGFSSNGVMSAAAGTNTSNYVANLNEAALRGLMTTYTTNLLGSLPANVSVQQVLGGWQIVASTNMSLPTSLLFPVYHWSSYPAMDVTNWSNEPTNLMATLSISFAGTNYQCFAPQLEGQRLSLTFDSNGLAQLWQEDTLLAQNTTSGSSGSTNVAINFDQPFGDWNFTNNTLILDAPFANLNLTNSYQRTNATYALTYAFEPDWGWLQERQNRLDDYLMQGLSNTSRQVVSETLNVMGLNWMLQTENASHLMEPQMGILPQCHCRMGRVAQETGNGYYVDIAEIAGFISNSGWDTTNEDIESRYFDLNCYFSSALEHGIIEQLQNTNIVGASTVKMLEIANTNGQSIFLASSANWSSFSVQSKLTAGGYSTAKIISLNGLVNQGYYVLLPQSATNYVAGTGSWKGYGYVGHLNITNAEAVTEFKISGGYNGGYSSYLTVSVNVPYIDSSSQNQPAFYASTPTSTPAPTAADPVDTADGTFQVENTDLSLGQAEPRGITLTRYYNGTRRYSNPVALGYGWVHNYYVNANTVAAPQAGLGGTTPAQAASMIVATYAAIGLYNDAQPDPKNWMVTALIAKWGIDQLTKNGVSINLGKDTLQFVQQPNGVFTPPANCTMTLTNNGSAYSLQERHGNTFNFNSLGWLSTIVDQYSNTLTATYSNNLVQTVTDWKGRSLTFDYVGGILSEVQDSTGRYIAYGHDFPADDLISYTDPDHNTPPLPNGNYNYDTNHQITATYNASGLMVVSNVYDALGHVTVQNTQGDPNKTWQIFWSGWQTVEQDPAGSQRVFSYDDQGRLISLRDQLGNLSQLLYDGQNHIVTNTSPLNETCWYIYDGNNNMTLSHDQLNRTELFYFDSQNNLFLSRDKRRIPTNYGYNSQFSLTGQTNGAGDWVNYAYNADGTLHTRTDSGGMTTYGYDSYGQLNSITHPNGLGSESFVNNALGDVISHTDANGNLTTFSYNNRRQMTNSVAPTNVVVTTAYDPVGNVASTTDARGNVTSNAWSATRHLLATTLPAVSQGAPVVTNLYDGREWLIGALDPLKGATQYTNDAAGHLIAATDPVLRTITFGYDADGRKLTTVNAANETNSQTWDARSELIQLTDGAGHVSLRAYDATGNQIILTNRNVQTWQFQFDPANRLTNTITPLGRSNGMIFNHQGLAASMKDPAGQMTTYGYDAKNRLISRADNVGTTAYGYDANDNRTNVTENGSTNAWTFDAYNRVSSYKDVYGNLIQYRYDAGGNLTNLVYPGGKNVYYAYDSNNHMTNVTDWAGRKTGIGYDLAGHLTGITRPNGTCRTLAYDAAGELTNIWEQMGNTLPIAWFRHNWNAAAEMQWEFAAPLPHSVTVPTRTMTYDNDNRLATFNGSSVSNDPDGNLTFAPLPNGTFTNYAFDARNRLLNAGGVTNAYDAMNNRIGQTQGTNATVFVVTPNAKLPQVLMRIKNGVTNYYVYGPGLLYQVTEAASGTNTLTYHYDYRGSTIALTGDNGLVTDRIEYSLYGLTTYRAGTNDTPFLFNGRYGVMTDPNGLLYMRARYYNPFLCRFLNPDPTGFKGGLNMYAAFNGNPVSYLDPSGLGAVGDNQSVSWLTGSSAVPANLADPFGLALANEQPDWVDKTIDYLNAKIDAYQQAQAARPEWQKQLDQFAQLAVMSMVPEAGLLNASASSTALEPMANAAFNTGTIRTIAGYEVAGNAGLVGTSYNVNIWGLYATENSEGAFSFVNTLNSEARAAGASQISITGTSVINPSLFNMSPAVAGRLGFQFTQVNPTTILLQGAVR